MKGYTNKIKQNVLRLYEDSITITELVVVSGYSDGYIRKILASLKEKKLIVRQGGNKTGKWVVIG